MNAFVERLDAQASGEERLQRIAAEQQLAGAEAARIDDHQAALGPQLQAHTYVRGIGLGSHSTAPVMRRC